VVEIRDGIGLVHVDEDYVQISTYLQKKLWSYDAVIDQDEIHGDKPVFQRQL
jgi:hypothetical protein